MFIVHVRVPEIVQHASEWLLELEFMFAVILHRFATMEFIMIELIERVSHWKRKHGDTTRRHYSSDRVGRCENVAFADSNHKTREIQKRRNTSQSEFFMYTKEKQHIMMFPSQSYPRYVFLFPYSRPTRVPWLCAPEFSYDLCPVLIWQAPSAKTHKKAIVSPSTMNE